MRACIALETRLAAILAAASSPKAGPKPATKPASSGPNTTATPRQTVPSQPPPSFRPTPKQEGPQASRLRDTTSLATSPHLYFAPAPRPDILPGLGQSPTPTPRATDPPRPRAA